MKDFMKFMTRHRKKIEKTPATLFPIITSGGEKKRTGQFAIEPGWWARYQEANRPVIVLHQLRDKTVEKYWIECKGKMTKIYEIASTKFEFGQRQSSYAWVSFEHNLDGESVIFMEDRPAYFWEHDHHDPKTIPQQIPVSSMTFSHPRLSTIPDVVMMEFPPFMDTIIQNRRMIGMKNKSNDLFEFTQNIKHGPMLLEFDQLGHIVSGFCANAKLIFPIGRDKFDAKGRWKSSEYEYLAREMIANPDLDVKGLA